MTSSARCGSSLLAPSAPSTFAGIPRRARNSAVAWNRRSVSGSVATSRLPVRRYEMLTPLIMLTRATNLSNSSRLRTVRSRSGPPSRASMYGARTPAEACVAPMPAGRSSTISTEAPRRASSYATAHPIIPAPTTTTSLGPATTGILALVARLTNFGPTDWRRRTTAVSETGWRRLQWVSDTPPRGVFTLVSAD